MVKTATKTYLNNLMGLGLFYELEHYHQNANATKMVTAFAHIKWRFTGIYHQFV